MGLGIFLSRIAGLVRERVFAHYFGNSLAAGAFRAALRIPNFLQNLFGEGVLSASFIPVYSGLLAKGEDEIAGRTAGIIATLLASLVSILCILGVLFSSTLVDLVAPGFEGEVRTLTIDIVRILFPGIALLVLSAWCLGILNSHRKFFVSYSAPVLWNLAMILTLICFGSHSDENSLAVYLAWGTVAGCALQLIVQLPFVFKFAPRIIFGFSTKLHSVRMTIKNTLPVLMGRGIIQTSAYIDSMISSFLGPIAVAGLGYAQTIYLLPISLFGMSVAAAELPAMSTIAANSDAANEALIQRLKKSQLTVASMILPSIVALSVLGKFVVTIIYQTGKFTESDTLFVWYILIGASVGLLPNTWGRLYSSTLYALLDTKTPLKCASVRVLATVLLGILFAFPLRPLFLQIFLWLGVQIPFNEIQMGAVGLSFSSSLAGIIEYALLKRSLSKRLGNFKCSRAKLMGCLFAAISSSLIALSLALLMPDSIHPLVRALLIMGVFGSIYLGISMALRLRG